MVSGWTMTSARAIISASPHEHRIRGVGRGRGDRVGQQQTGWVGARARDHRADGDRPAGRGIRDAHAEADPRRRGKTPAFAFSTSSPPNPQPQHPRRLRGSVRTHHVSAHVEVSGRRYRAPTVKRQAAQTRRKSISGSRTKPRSRPKLKPRSRRRRSPISCRLQRRN
jgi:hypothetical protein